MQKKNNSKPEVDWRSVNRKCTETLEWDDIFAKFEGISLHCCQFHTR